MDLDTLVKASVAEALALSPGEEAMLGLDTALLGVHPDFNSMAVLTLVTALEDQLGVSMADDLRADAFATVGTLVADIRHRLDIAR